MVIEFGAVRKPKSRSQTPGGKRTLEFGEGGATRVERDKTSPSKSPRSVSSPKAAPPVRSRSLGPVVASQPQRFDIGSQSSTPRTNPGTPRKEKGRSSSEAVDSGSQPKEDSPSKRQATNDGRLRSTSSSGLSSSYVKIPEGTPSVLLPIENIVEVDVRNEIAELRAELRRKDAELVESQKRSHEEMRKERLDAEKARAEYVMGNAEASGIAIANMRNELYQAVETLSAQSNEAASEFNRERMAHQLNLEQALHSKTLSQQQIQHLIESIKLLERHADEMKRKLDDSQEHVQKLMQYNIGAEAQVNTTQLDLDKCRHERGDLESKLRDCCNQRTELEKRLKDEISRSLLKDTDLTRVRKEAQEATNDLNVRAQTFEVQLKSASERLEEANIRNIALKTELDEKERTLRDFHSQSIASGSTNEQNAQVWQQRIETQVRDIDRLNAEKANLESVIDKLKREGESCWQRNAVLTSENNQLNEEKSECWRQHGPKDREIADLKRKVLRLESELSDERLRIHQSTFEIAELVSVKSDLEEQHAHLLGAKEKLREELRVAHENHEKRVKNLMEECSKSDEKVSSVCDEKVRKLRESQKKEIEELQKEWEIKHKGWIKRESELESEIHTLQDELSDLQEQINDLPAGTADATGDRPVASPRQAGASGQGGGPPDDGDGGPGKGSGNADSSGKDDDKKKDPKKSSPEDIMDKVSQMIDNKMESMMNKIGKNRKRKPDGGGDEPDDDDGSDYDDDEDSDGVGISVRKRNGKVVVKRKDVEKVVVPKFPTILQVPGWKQRVARNLCSATGMTDLKEIPWILEVTKAGTTMDSLLDSGAKRFKQLDIRLAVALSSCVKDGCSELDRVLQQKEAVLMDDKGECLRGRQIFWMILDYFKTNRDVSVVYTIQDLTNLEWMGDKHMQSFKFYWETMSARMTNELSEKSLSEILVDKMSASQVLHEDVMYYHRIRDEHEDHTYQFLLACMDRYLARQRLLKNRRDNRIAFKKHSDAAPGVKEETPVEDPEKKKKKKKKKKRSSSAAPSNGDSDAAPGPKGQGKGKSRNSSRGSSPSGDGRSQKKTACIYFQTGECNKGSDCRFEHRKVGQDELNKLKSKLRSSSPGGKGKGGKGNGNQRSSSAPKMGSYCHNFVSQKGCPRGDSCKFPHLNESAVEEIKKAHKNALAQYEKNKAAKK